MTQILHLTIPELQAMQGLSLEARTLYVFELRRYVGPDDVSGRVRRHSYQSFREQLTFVPDRGSKKRQPEITVGKIRAALAELERAGLIEMLPEPLVFLLKMTSVYKSAQMRNDRGTTEERHEQQQQETVTPQRFQSDEQQPVTFRHSEERHTSQHSTSLKAPTTTRAENPHLYQPDNFPMFIGWRPSPEHMAAMPSFGTNPALMTGEAMADFYSYWMGEGCTAKQGQWEHRLNNHLKTFKPKAVNTGAAHENRSPAPRKLTPVQQVRIANGMDPDTGEFLDDWQPGGVVHVN